MKLTNQVAIEFLDGTFNVTVSVERQLSLDKTDARWIIDAVTETGFDLTNSSFGFVKYSVEASKRLKAEASIKREGTELLNDVIEVIKTNAIRTINKALVVSHELRDSQYQFIKGIPFPTHCVKSKQSGQVIAWHEHDVYNSDVTLDIELVRLDSGQLQAFADETLLYDKAKLEKLADSERFQAKGFTFFFYNEVNRLLGRSFKGSAKAISGLFASGAK